eukprot:gene10229-2386_t
MLQKSDKLQDRNKSEYKSPQQLSQCVANCIYDENLRWSKQSSCAVTRPQVVSRLAGDGDEQCMCVWIDLDLLGVGGGKVAALGIMNEFLRIHEDLLIYFNREVDLDLSGDGSPGFDLTPAGTPTYDRYSEGCFITNVKDETEASKRQLLSGDYVLKINGDDATTMSVDEMRAKISEGGTIKLLIECCAVARLQKQETTLFKIKDSGSKPRYYRINPAGTRIYWKSRSKKARNANIRVGDIKELRRGRKTQSFQRCYASSRGKRQADLGGPDGKFCFSIIYNDTFETLDLMAHSQVDYDTWVLAGEYFAHRNSFYTLDEVPHDESSARSRWLRDLFEQADINGDHQLSLSEVKMLLRKLNISLPSKVIAQRFHAVRRVLRATMSSSQ